MVKQNKQKKKKKGMEREKKIYRQYYEFSY